MSVVLSRRPPFHRQALLGLACGCSLSVVAQDNADTASNESATAAQLDRIVITATRREQALARVPLSVQVIDGEALEAAGARGFLDWAANVPGLSFAQAGAGAGSATPVIRGIADDLSCCDVNPATALYFGEVPITQAGGGVINYNPELELYDLQRIEVLRGPQGSYFGAGAMSGAIRLIPRSPELERQTVAGGLRFDSVWGGGAGGGGHAILNHPLSETAALRSVFYQRRIPGWIDDPRRDNADVNGGNVGGARLAGLWLPQDSLELEWTLLAQRSEQDGLSAGDPVAEGLIQRRQTEESLSDRNRLGSLDLNWSGQAWSLHSTSAWFDRQHRGDIDIETFAREVYGFAGPMHAANRVGQREWTQELRLIRADEGRWNLVLGAFWQRRVHRYDQDFPAPGFVAQFPEHAEFGLGDNLWRGRSRLLQEQWAGFFDAAWRLGERWELSAGARQYRIERQVENDFLGGFGTSRSRFAADDEGVAPRLGLSFVQSADRQWYANAARGFRPGSFNDPSGSELPSCQAELLELGYRELPREYDPDRLWSYELGARQRSAQGRLQWGLTAYHIDWSEIQFPLALDCIGLVFIDNLDRARSRGVEAELQVWPHPAWQFDLTATYSDAEVRSGPLAGLPLPGAARWNYAVALHWMPTRFAGHWRLGYQYRGRAALLNQSDPDYGYGGFGVVNLSYQRPLGRWLARLALNNLGDRRGRLGVSPRFLGQQETTLMPRSLSLSLELSMQ